MSLRRAGLLVLPLALAACTEVTQQPLPPDLVFASFASPNIPTPNDLALSATVVRKNGQVSAGVVVNLTPKWRCALEQTHYVTTYNDAAQNRFVANQTELSTLYAF